MTTTKKTTATTSRAKTTATKKPAAPKAVKIAETIPELPANPFVFEILNVAAKQKSNAKKVEALQKYAHPCLKTLFIWNFDETIQSALPPGDVPYSAVNEMDSFKGTLSEKIADAVDKMEELGTNSLGSQDQGRSSIRKEYQKFYNFVKGGNDSLSSLRRETMFINLLQGLHPLEAEIVCLVKDKKLETKYNINKDVVSQAFPDIIWGGRS
jgi:Family of unknown function (DUF6433)